jgi:hypothetical protein
MIKRSWTMLIAVSLFMLIFQVSVVSAETPGEATQEASPSLQSQANLTDIFTAFSEVNNALDKDINDYQKSIDGYANDLVTPSATNSNLLRLNESLMNTRSKAFSWEFTDKYNDDKIQMLRACDMLDQSQKDMKISVSLRNTSYYSKAKQELQDAIQFKAFVWKQLQKDLQEDGYVPSK